MRIVGDRDCRTNDLPNGRPIRKAHLRLGTRMTNVYWQTPRMLCRWVRFASVQTLTIPIAPVPYAGMSPVDGYRLCLVGCAIGWLRWGITVTVYRNWPPLCSDVVLARPVFRPSSALAHNLGHRFIYSLALQGLLLFAKLLVIPCAKRGGERCRPPPRLLVNHAVVGLFKQPNVHRPSLGPAFLA